MFKLLCSENRVFGCSHLKTLHHHRTYLSWHRKKLSSYDNLNTEKKILIKAFSRPKKGIGTSKNHPVYTCGMTFDMKNSADRVHYSYLFVYLRVKAKLYRIAFKKGYAVRLV